MECVTIQHMETDGLPQATVAVLMKLVAVDDASESAKFHVDLLQPLLNSNVDMLYRTIV